MDQVPVRLSSIREAGGQCDLELAGMLYLPDALAPRAAAAQTAGGAAAQPVPGLVVGHGAGSRAANHAGFCLEARRQGFAVLAIDFRGHGESAGSVDGPLEQDILAAVRCLRAHPAVDPRRICYRGSSMGGFYGLRAEPEAGFAAMALLCPAGESVILEALDDDEDSEAPARQGQGAASASAAPRWDKPRLRAYFAQQDSRELAARVRCPILLVHARPDLRVPFAHSLTLAEHLRTDTTLVALESGSHTSAQHDPAVHAYTAAWLWSRISETRTSGT
jgi:dipeptidyl aminopeptidase/acylaminoacyl peptidase